MLNIILTGYFFSCARQNITTLIINCISAFFTDKRLDSDGQIEYSIKWKGYGDEDNTWEPIENFESDVMKAMIAEYEENQKVLRILDNANIKIPKAGKKPKQGHRIEFRYLCK